MTRKGSRYLTRMISVSIDCDMEATLLHLIFYVAAFLLTKIAEDLGEHPFQSVVTYGATGRAFGVFHCYVPIITKVESSAIQMATVFCGILVAVA